MKNTISTGLLSFGMSGKVFHGPLLQAHPLFNFKAVVERTKDNSKNTYPAVKQYRNVEAILDDNELELVIVNTPDDTHYQFARNALEAGKHVVVEKPMTLKSSDGEKLIRLAKEKGLVFTVFHNRRWDGDFMTVRQITAEGLLGQIVEYEARYDRYRTEIRESWKENPSVGTGTIFNLGSHLIDQALCLFGKPRSLFAKVEKRRKGANVDDFFDLKLYYPGLVATLKGSYLVKEPGPRYMVHGTKGSFLKYGTDPQEEALENGLIPGGKDWGAEPEGDWGIINYLKGENDFRGKYQTVPGNYLAFYDNLYQAIREGESLAVSPFEALEAIRVIEMALESNDLGKEISLE